MCTAACIAQAFMGLAAEIGLGSILASDRIYIGQIDNANGLACWVATIVQYGGQQEGRLPLRKCNCAAS